VVVLMHGFGAPGDDLAQLWRVLDVPHEVRFVFPEAPLSPEEFAPFAGRAWWRIDTAALEEAMAGGERPDRSHDEPDGMAEAHAAVLSLLDAVQQELDVPGERIVLGGFSQGAMLACDVALGEARPLAGLVLLSGTLLAQPRWQAAMPARASLPVFQSHGRRDPLLPFAAAERLRDLFTGAGCNVDWVEFGGAHEIPMDVLQRLGAFLRRCFGE
jgi:phospholipase/carboxylesterase